MSVHIYHHYDADGYASAAVLIRYALSSIVDDNLIQCYSCEHSSTMNFENVKEDDIVFIVDYSFPDSDKENLKNLFNNVTKEIYWIDHHATSDRIVSECDEFFKMSKNGLLDTTNIYSGCLLTYLWTLNFKVVHSGLMPSKLVVDRNHLFDIDVRKMLNEDPSSSVYSVAPLWVQLISDHDTFRHQIEDSLEFARGLLYEGLYNVFLNKESLLSFTYNIPSDDIYYEYANIRNIVNKGKIIITNDEIKNKSLCKNNAFKSIFTFIDENNEESHFSVICLNGYGNSTVFGELYDIYNAVCIFNYDGEKYRYSLYAKKESKINCSHVGLYFNNKYKMNGGGHCHAAGWSCPINIFEKDKNIEIKLSEINK